MKPKRTQTPVQHTKQHTAQIVKFDEAVILTSVSDWKNCKLASLFHQKHLVRYQHTIRSLCICNLLPGFLLLPLGLSIVQEMSRVASGTTKRKWAPLTTGGDTPEVKSEYN